MNRFEGSSAVSNARTAILALAWLFLVVGIIVLIIGFMADYLISWELVTLGVSLLFMGVVQFIMNAVLKGFEQIVMANETYMDELSKAKSEAREARERKTPTQVQ